jgi:hypothetical protein
MTVTRDLLTLRIDGPGSMIKALPYLLGFRPVDSLVMIGMDAGQMVLALRLDLAETGSDEVMGAALSAMRRGGASAFVGIVVTDVPVVAGATLPYVPLAGRLETLGAQYAMATNDVLLVVEDRWWSLVCANRDCCPPQGHPVPPQTTEVEAEAVAAGLVPMANRDALAATLDPFGQQVTTEQIAVAVQAERDADLSQTRATFDRSVIRALFAATRSEHPEQLPLSQMARFGVALSGYAVRDSLWLAQDGARIEGRELWRTLATRLPVSYRSAPLFLFGWSAWRAGDGALASIATERALSADPGYGAASLLQVALARGLDPRSTPTLRNMPPA